MSRGRTVTDCPSMLGQRVGVQNTNSIVKIRTCCFYHSCLLLFVMCCCLSPVHAPPCTLHCAGRAGCCSIQDPAHKVCLVVVIVIIVVIIVIIVVIIGIIVVIIVIIVVIIVIIFITTSLILTMMTTSFKCSFDLSTLHYRCVDFTKRRAPI